MKSDVYVLHFNYFILEFLNVTIRSDSVGNERTAEPQNYIRRIMEVEHGTFTPLIFTTTGVMGHECSIFHKAWQKNQHQKERTIR